MTLETITAKKIDMRFDECYIKDVEENYKPYVCVACDTFLTFRSKMTIAVNKLCDCFDILAMKDCNRVEQSLCHQYIVTDLPDCIELQGKNILQKTILSPRASYVTFEDNRKTDGYTICRQCKYHLCRVEIFSWRSVHSFHPIILLWVFPKTILMIWNASANSYSSLGEFMNIAANSHEAIKTSFLGSMMTARK